MYIICHMVSSIDGRIDCPMVEQISGNEYYDVLKSYGDISCINGGKTVNHYYVKEHFVPQNSEPIGCENVFFANQSDKFFICVDNKASLKYESHKLENKYILCILSEDASKEYLLFLQKKKISYICTGKQRPDLKKAVEILDKTMNIQKAVLLGGGKTNGAFLQAGLIDEISLLIGAGVDARINQPALFDGLNEDFPVSEFKLKSCEALDCGTAKLVYIR